MYDRVLIWDTASGRLLREIGSHKGNLGVALFAPDGRRLLTAGTDGRAVLWDAGSGRELWRLKGIENEAIYEAAFTPDGRWLLTASHERDPGGKSYLRRNGTVRLWDAAIGAELCTLVRQEGELGAVGLSPDGQTVIANLGWQPVLTRTWPVDFLSAARSRRPRDLTPRERARFELPGQ
jgi:hypothetical protein